MIKGDFVLACLSALVLEVVADLQKKLLLLLLLCGPSGQIQHNKISCKISVLLDKATNMTLVQQTSQGRKEGRKERAILSCNRSFLFFSDSFASSHICSGNKPLPNFHSILNSLQHPQI